MKKSSFSSIAKRARRAFTLLEMVMVMAIIAVLAGGAIYTLKGVGDSSNLQRVDTDMESISTALMQYKTMTGRLPTQDQGLEALIEKPTKQPIPRRYRPIMDKLALDPWNNAYVYKIPGSKNSKTFELISYGEDGVEGGGDDLSSQDE